MWWTKTKHGFKKKKKIIKYIFSLDFVILISSLKYPPWDPISWWKIFPTFSHIGGPTKEEKKEGRKSKQGTWVDSTKGTQIKKKKIDSRRVKEVALNTVRRAQWRKHRDAFKLFSTLFLSRSLKRSVTNKHTADLTAPSRTRHRHPYGPLEPTIVS